MKHYIWDFDGTLFDTYPAIIYHLQELLSQHNIHEDYERLLKLFMINEAHAVNVMMQTYHLDDRFLSAYTEAKKAVQYDLIKPFECAKQVCQTIRENKGHSYIFTHRNASVHTILEKYDMQNLFEEIITGENRFKRKPDPEAVIYLIDKYQMDKSETLIIGDRTIEIELGKQVGIKTCYFNSANQSITTQPDFMIDHLNEVLKIQ